jgi:Family of unknown function (DUF6328)
MSDENSSETDKERVDRELIELLNGLRVLLPGVQVLFAFLLSVPFANGFTSTTDFQRDLFFVTLITAAAATVLLAAPAAQHRMLFRSGAKEKLLKRANAYAVAGSLALGAAACSGVLLITDFVFDRWLAFVTAALVAVMTGWAWFVQPLRHRARHE